MRYRRMGALPDRCVLCNADAQGGRVRRTLYCSPLAWRIGAVAAPFVALWAGIALDFDYVIYLFWPLVITLFVAHFFVRKSVKVELGVCWRHRRIRHILIAASLLSIAAVVLGFMGAVAWRTGWELLLGGALGLLVFAIVGRYVGVRAIRLDSLTEEDAWLGGTGSAFREALPELPG